MKTRTLLLFFAFIAAVAFAQRGSGTGPMSNYDASAETTISGTIEEINIMDMMCHSGTHLTVKTDKGNMEVALGPSKFLSDQKLDLKKGDQIQIVGAKANTGRGEIIMARQITRSGKTVTLRDEKGTPGWPRDMCR